jgi:hypothetical protein
MTRRSLTEIDSPLYGLDREESTSMQSEYIFDIG